MVHYYTLLAITLDGFIARYSGQMSDWTSKEDREHLTEMENKADVLLMSRISYEVAKNYLTKRKCLILTRSVDSVKEVSANEVYINPEKTDLQKYIQKNDYNEVCVLGGRGAYNYCLENNMIGDLYITIEPLLFGEGITAFNKKIKTKEFELIESKKLNENGSLLLHYRQK